MDGENKHKNSSSSVISTSLAIFAMAVLFFGGLAVSQLYVEAATGKESKESATSTTTTSAPTTEIVVEEPEEDNNLNCGDIQERNFPVDPSNDPNGFDGDKDGIGCETQLESRGTEFTELETVVTIEVIELLEEESPDVSAHVEAEAEEIAANVTEQTPAAETTSDVEILVEDLEQEVAQNDTAVAAELPATVNETAVVEEVAEIAIVDQALENEGVDVNTIANVSLAVENVEITVEDIAVAADQVAQEGTVENEVTTTTTTTTTVSAEEPSKEDAPGKEENTTTTTTVVVESNVTAPSAVVDVAVEEAVEEAAPEIAEQTGQDEATVAELLQNAAEAIAAAQTRLGV